VRPLYHGDDTAVLRTVLHRAQRGHSARYLVQRDHASPSTCVNVQYLGVGESGASGRLEFAMDNENPVRQEARFSFALPARAKVELGLYDVSGRLVRMLVDEELAAGPHDAVWDLRTKHGRVPAGMFFARIKAGSEPAALRVPVIQ